MPVSNTSPNVDNYYVGKGIVKWKKLGDSVWRDLGNVPEFEFNPNVDKLEHFSSRQGVRVKDKTIVRQKTATFRVVTEEFTAANLELMLMGSSTGGGGNTATITAEAGNVGNGTAAVASPSTGVGAQDGQYRAVCVGTATNGGTFEVYDPNGDPVGTATVGTLFSNEVRFTISDGSTDFAAGDEFKIDVVGASSDVITIDIFSETEIEGAIRFIGTNDVGPRMQMDFPSVTLTPSSAVSPITDEWGRLEINGDVNADPVTGSFGTAHWNITTEIA